MGAGIYLHVPAVRLPHTLRELHLATVVGAPVAMLMLGGEGEGPLPDDDFPGRFFARWRPDRLADVLVGAGFEVDECAPEAETEWIGVRMTPGADAPRHRGPGDAAPAVRPQPEHLLG